MRSIKLDNDFHIVSQKVCSDKTVAINNNVNHIFVVDVSGSMYHDLPLIRKQLKNRLSSLMNDGDTISIIWFSGQNESGILKEEIEIKSLKTLTDLHNAIDRFLIPVGLTAFHKPLVLAKEVIDRIKKNRPDSLFSLIFLTDGYNNNCSWDSVIKALGELNNELSSSTFVEYGYYADTQRLTEMASMVGGEKISTSDFDEFEPVFENKLSSSVNSGKKINIHIGEAYKYDFAFSVNDAGGVMLYNIVDNKVLVPENIDELHHFSEIPCDDEYYDNDKLNAILYSAIYVLSDKLMNFEAEKVFYALGDNYYYRQLVNAFGKQKLNKFKNSIKECISDKSKRFPEGKDVIKHVPDDAYCLMDLINNLSNMDDCLFYPNHEDFNYKRIGTKRNVLGSKLSENEKKLLTESDNINDIADMVNKLKETKVDLKFITTDPDKGYPMTDLVWNEERANLSVRVRYDGYVDLPKNNYDLDSIFTFKYRTYTIIKDGILNIEKLPISYSKELETLLTKNNVSFKLSTTYESENNDLKRRIVIDLTSIPIINRKMVKDISATELAKLEWELSKLQGKNKVYNHYRKTLFPKESKTFTETLGEDASNWLKDIGITDYNGFAPKTEDGESTDVYMSIVLSTKIKGLSSLPKVDDVLKKMETGKSLKLNEWIMQEPLNGYHNQINSELFKTISEENKKIVLKEYLEKMTKNLVNDKRTIMQKVAEIKFSLILSKKWFTEFKSFDENSLEIEMDGHKVQFKFDLTEKETKI